MFKFLLTIGLTISLSVAAISAEKKRELIIVGTGSGSNILREVGKAFTKQNPEITVTVPKSIGSGGGIKGVGEDEYIIGRVARKLQKKEEKYNLKLMQVAKIPIVFYVNTSVKLEDASPKQICRIYDGTIREWQEIDGGDGKIRVIRRENGDSSLLILRKSFPGFKDLKQTDRSKMTFSDPNTLKECIKQKNSIAYGTWANIKKESKVRALKISGVHPTDKAYPYYGMLSIIYKEKNCKGDLKKFIEFISSKAAEKAIENAGGMAVE